MKITLLNINIWQKLAFLTVVGILSLMTGCRSTLPAADSPPLGNPAQADATYVGEGMCVACHQVENSHWSHTVHARVFYLNPQNSLQTKGCEACHGPGLTILPNLPANPKSWLLPGAPSLLFSSKTPCASNVTGAERGFTG
ncbi:hypothetical protein NOC27_2862 [Nitrosococcus oceani AFC27]|nr:hypothetical protein NOC27_2862 [Nitrosococcus oceani AFC27]